MSISNRLSLFFLSTLALVLVGFSVTLYGLARWHLNSQLDRHLESAMHVLIAAIEVHPEDVQWEPLERKITLGIDLDLTQVRWTLHDDHGRLIDCSENLAGDSPIQLDATSSEWRTSVRQLSAGRFVAEVPELRPLPPSSAIIADLPADRSATRMRFVLSAALSEAPVHAALSQMAIAMGLVSLITWATAAVWGHWLCKRALFPIMQMAAKARTLQQSPESRALLEVSPTGDELTDLGQAFNHLLVTLRDTIERQQRFAGDASHQLRTPLAAMLTAVDVAVRHERSAEEYQRIPTASKATCRRPCARTTSA